MAKFPDIRMRRLRNDAWIRSLVQETQLSVNDLILPIFLTDKKSEKTKIGSLPDVFKLGEKEVLKIISEAENLEIKAIALFPVIEDKYKTDNGEYSYDEGNFIFSRIRAIKEKFPEIGIIADVALDPYTSHGHDGVVDEKKGEVLNDETIEILVKQSLALVSAGADVIAPSDMMDGRVGCIRNALEDSGYKDKIILSYSAKYASALYGPFRDAVGSGKNLKNSSKETYQMQPANIDEAIKEVKLDIEEGADIVMVKPAGFYLDVIKAVKDKFKTPLFAYQVSGEYAMMKFAAENANMDFNKLLLESLISIKRAGANAILTYGALEAARLISRDKEV